MDKTMHAIVVQVFIFSSFLFTDVKSDHIICNANTTHSCDISTNNLTCIEDGNCLIECNGPNACSSFESINCAKHGDCIVKCNGTYACNMPSSGAINCPLAPHSCTIECDGDYACGYGIGAQYNSITQKPNTGGDFTVRCLPPSIRSCYSGSFMCPSAPYTCNISCFGCKDAPSINARVSAGLTLDCVAGGSCRYPYVYCPLENYPCVVTLNSDSRDAWIVGGGGDLVLELSQYASQGVYHCPTNAICNITCTGDCLRAASSIDATNSSELNFIVATAERMTDTYRIIDIWCPYNGKRDLPNCNIIVSNSNGSISLNNIRFNAVQGVNDLTFICDHKAYEGNCAYFDSSSAPNVACLEDYSEECTLATYGYNTTPNAWHCTDPSSVCNDYLLPTAFPTASPTAYPTDASSNPTKYPSLDPTVDPTKPRSAAVDDTISSTMTRDENIEDDKPKTMFELPIFYVIVAVSSICCVFCVCVLLYQIQLRKKTKAKTNIDSLSQVHHDQSHHVQKVTNPHHSMEGDKAIDEGNHVAQNLEGAMPNTPGDSVCEPETLMTTDVYDTKGQYDIQPDEFVVKGDDEENTTIQ
eukprot:916_1